MPALFQPLDNGTLAHQLRGRLLLVYGDLDENAMPALTLQLARALNHAVAGLSGIDPRGGIALANPDVPHAPYRIMAERNDHPRGLRDSVWVRDPDSGQWTRQVADGLLDGRMHYRTRIAGADKATELDAYAAGRWPLDPRWLAVRQRGQRHAAAGTGGHPCAAAAAIAVAPARCSIAFRRHCHFSPAG